MGLMQTILGGSESESGSKVFRPQKKELKNLYDNARSLYDSRSGTPWFGGDLYAGINGTQQQGVNSLTNFANGGAMDLYNGASQAALGALGGGQQAGNAASSLFNQAGQDPTQSLINSASQYANNPYIDGMVDNASRDITRQFSENDMPALNLAATGSGNANSSRTGGAEAILQRGAADRIGDISSQIRGGAYSQGLNTALSAMNSGRSTQLGASGQLQGLLGMGMNGAAMANNLGVSQGNTLLGAGGVLQSDAQRELDALYQKWQGNDTRETDILSAYQGHIGSPIQNSFSNSMSTPGIAGFLGDMAAAGGSPVPTS